MIRRFIIVTCAFLSILFSCKKDDNGDDKKVVYGVNPNASSLDMEQGQQAQLIATILPEGTTGVPLSWSSSPTGVVQVEGGMVTAISVGETTVTVTAEDCSASCYVRVVPRKVVQEVRLNHSSLDMEQGQQVQLIATILPKGTTGVPLSWSSSPTGVVQVEGGMVTAISVGETTVKVTAEDCSASCLVQVLPVDPISFKDKKAEQFCLERWDFNGDGIFSKREAAAVEEADFRGSMISDFPEFVYFTGLKGRAFFYGLTTLTNIVLPPNLTKIYEQSFVDCQSLSSLELPESLQVIEDKAFWNCYSLNSLMLPRKMRSIGSYVFNNCLSLKEITLPEEVENLSSYCFSNCAITSVAVPKGMTSIPEGFAYKCRSLTEVILPEGVLSTGLSAFEDCPNLVSVSFPEGFHTVGDNSFQNCGKLLDIKWPTTLEKIGSYAFSNAGIQSLSLPDHVRVLKTCSFYNNPIKRLSLPSSLTHIGQYAFDKCQIQEFYFPYCPDLEEIGISAFGNVKAPFTFTLPSRLKCIDQYVFNNSGLTAVYGPPEGKMAGEWEIKEYAFYNCKQLASIELPEGLKSIGDQAFYNNAALSGTLTIPYGTKTIGKCVFYDCWGITGVNLPNSLTLIEMEAFYRTSISGMLEVPVPESQEGLLLGLNSLGATTITGYIIRAPQLIFFSLIPFKKVPIYVPENLVEACKTRWPQYKEYIHSLVELE